MEVSKFSLGSYEFEILVNPRENASKTYQDYLTLECTNVARDGFGNPDMSSDEIEARILDTSMSVFVRDRSGKIFAFSTSSVKTIDDYYVIYLPSTVVAKKYAGKRIHNVTLYLRVCEEIKNIKKIDQSVSEDHILIAGRTQSPLVYRILNRKLGLYPNPDGSCDDKIRVVAEKLAHGLCGYPDDMPFPNPFLFDQDHLISKKAYKLISETEEIGVNLYDSSIPFCQSDDEINTYMKNYLDWQNGDALIMIGPYCQDKVQDMFDQAQEEICRSSIQAA